MPEIRYYTCTQEREVKVAAISPIAAAKIADEAFANDEAGIHCDDGRTTSPVRNRSLDVREDY